MDLFSPEPGPGQAGKSSSMTLEESGMAGKRHLAMEMTSFSWSVVLSAALGELFDSMLELHATYKSRQ